MENGSTKAPRWARTNLAVPLGRGGLALAAALAAVACAEEVPGVPPPEDQLHYPAELIVAGDRLLVLNGNFDQRYNAGSVMTLSAPALGAALSGFSFDDPEADPVIVQELPAEDRTRVRIPSFAGEAVFVPESAGAETGSLYVASRGADRITVVRIGEDRLICGTEGVAKDRDLRPTDCTAGHSIPTTDAFGQGADPFALALVDRPGERLLAVGHLNALETATVITFFELANLDERIAAETAGQELPILFQSSNGIPGLTDVNGLVFTGSAAPDGGRLIVSTGGYTGNLSLSLFRFAIVENESERDLIDERPLGFASQTNANGMRGIVLSGDGTRAYVSVRFPERSTIRTNVLGPLLFNSAIAVIAVEPNRLRLISMLEIGEELGRPALLEREVGGQLQRLVYLPDARTDAIWIADVTHDVPTIAGRIEPRYSRGSGESLERIDLLRVPFAIRFAPQPIEGRQLAFVSNFGNSTLALVDVTSPAARDHRVVARFGRALSSDGVEEAP